MLSGAAYPRLKTNREENSTKYDGSIGAHVKEEKTARVFVNDEKRSEQAEKTRPIIEKEKRDLLYFIL